MTDINEVAAVIASALTEASLTGTLDVSMGGGEAVEALGVPTGADVEVVVIVKAGSSQPPRPDPIP